MRSIAAEFKRAVKRCIKMWRDEPLTIDDISTVKSASFVPGDRDDSDSEHYEARRNGKGTWDVDHVRTLVDIGVHGVHISPIPKRVNDGQNLTLPQALDLMTSLSPADIRFSNDNYNRPVAVARMIGHTLPGAPAPKTSPSVKPAL